MTLLLAALLAWCLAAPAAVAAPAESPGERIAKALRESPVYVDPAYESVVRPAEQRELAQRIERTKMPIKVILVPLATGDEWGGKSDQLAEAVRDRLGGKAGSGEEAAFVTMSDTSADALSGHDWPFDRFHALDAVAAVDHQPDMRGKRLAARVERAVDNIASGDGDAIYDKATAHLEDGTGRDDGPDAGSGWALPLALGAALVAVLGTAGFLLVRRRRSAAAAPFAAPRAVLAAAREADEASVRRRAQEEVVAFGEELSTAETGDGGDPEALRRALDAYTAAGSVLDRADGIPDLAGVLALVAEGRDALARAPRASRKRRPLPLCFFHPLHGRAQRRIRWRPLGRRDALHVAVCAECRTAVAERRAPAVLTAQHEGRDVPYFEVPAEHSLWAATGYGSLGDEPLADRVARGDFTRG
nr:hypothetical protein [Streptomyces sp. HNM0574]